MNNIYLKYYEEKLLKRSKDGLYRKLHSEDKGKIDLSSNDYLGLATNMDFSDFLIRKISHNKLIAGSGGSRLLTGNNDEVENLEKKIAMMFKSETSVVFSSGYQANMALFSCLLTKNHTVLYDELCHASIKDGIRMSFAKKIPFKHNDYYDLESKLKKNINPAFIITESVFSMDGDTPDFESINSLALKYNSMLIVDEAHAVGVMGKGGIGLTYNLDTVFARIITFGKAYGVQGAALLCNNLIKEYIINFSRPFIYTTAPSKLILKSIDSAIEYVNNNPKLIDDLHCNINYWNYLINKYLDINLSNNLTPIQKIIIPEIKKLKEIVKILSLQGFSVFPILYPTVPNDKSRIRIVIHSFNKDEEFENFLISYKKLL